jgi:hypothetical protein
MTNRNTMSGKNHREYSTLGTPAEDVVMRDEMASNSSAMTSAKVSKVGLVVYIIHAYSILK